MPTELWTWMTQEPPLQAALWMTACGVGVLSWLLTLKIFVSYAEHNELKTYVAEHYIKRAEITEHLRDIQTQVQQMQIQLNTLQNTLFRLLN
jgi:hypothetical protein